MFSGHPIFLISVGLGCVVLGTYLQSVKMTGCGISEDDRVWLMKIPKGEEAIGRALFAIIPENSVDPIKEQASLPPSVPATPNRTRNALPER